MRPAGRSDQLSCVALRGRRIGARLRATEERGAILVITAVLLVAVVGFAALAIDVGSYYQTQRQAQGGADAAALAGADALAGGASAASVTATASSIATVNSPGATPAVTVNGNAVTVVVNTTSPSYFGRVFNTSNVNVSTRAVAAGSATATACTSTAQSNGKCAAVFAMDTDCSKYGVSATAGSININGDVHSNGSINDSSGGSTWASASNGPATDAQGNATGCTTNWNHYQETINNGGPISEPVITQWPIDYAAMYPACSGAACTGPSGTPSYCNYAGPNFAVTGTPTQGIYCAYGTSTHPNDPTTWNGTVQINNGGFPVTASYIAGSISINAGINSLAPAPNAHNMLFYATQPDTTSGKNTTYAINFGAGGYPVTGDTFAPNGTVAITAGINATTFLEGKDVLLGAGGYTITGDGPQTPSGGSSPGSASLTQ